MKYLISIFLIFTLNSCCKTCVDKTCTFPKLPIYKTPTGHKFSVNPLDENRSIIVNSVLFELVRNNAKLRGTCWKYATINKKINGEYHEKNNSK
jgi:hypothetical protein